MPPSAAAISISIRPRSPSDVSIVIAQGIAARVAAGSMAGQDFGSLGQEVLKIAEGGLSRLKED
jgi:hypothetical protein